MPQPWTLLPPATPSPGLIDAVGGHRLVAQLLAQRGFTTAEQARAFLDPTWYSPAPPSALFGVTTAAELLVAAIHQKQNILVWGDFDVDGQTSTSLLVAALQKVAGVDRVRFHVPNRFSEGHGIRLPKLQEKLADPTFHPQVLITCDTGIADGEAVEYAKAQGLTVLITDHHDPPPEILDLGDWIGEAGSYAAAIQNQKAKIKNLPLVLLADAIVNPKLQPPGDPLRTLPGVGVAYKLIQQLYALLDRAGEEQEFLDLVALGIVADVAEQVHDARYLLQLGLTQLRTTKRIGLLALMEIARLNPETVSADSIGFQLGPRMNALGRLEDATVAVELLTTRDIIRASQLAARMERLNQERRLLTSQITKAALDMVEREPKLLDYNGLVLAHEGWHAGIVGIVAARLVEEFSKPVVLLVKPPGEPARGSARSVAGVDIGAAIAACSPLLMTYGGHPGAAGLSLLPENLDRFRRELDRQIELHRDEQAPAGLLIDAEASFDQLNLDLAEALQHLAPFGNGNPTPQFLTRNLTVREERRIGADGSHRRLVLQSADGVRHPAIWFHGGDAELPAGSLDLVYTLNVNDYRGERTLQLGFVAARATAPETIAPLSTGTLRALPIHDLRQTPVKMTDLPAPVQATWYAEGDRLMAAENEIPFAPRTSFKVVTPGQPLVLWSVPPSLEVLHWLVETAAPSTIYLCGQMTSEDTVQTVLRHVGSMCKYALARDGLLNLERMAARLGTTEAMIRHSLLWLERRGLVALQEWEPAGTSADSIRIAPGAGARQDEEAEILAAELDEQLAEVRAYRRYFLRARVGELGLSATV
jgi:single-stranded-DNA-specific exonuclease